MDNIKTLFTFNNNEISIILFNRVYDDINVLFFNSVKLDEKIISNGFISNNEKVSEIISKLLLEADKFTSINIDEVYVCVDCNEITIKSLELSEINLKDGILDKSVWTRIKNDAIEIKQVVDKFIYDVHYISWNIDGKDYYELSNNSIAGNKLIIKAIMYQINKILYQNIERIFDKFNVKIKSFFPIANSFVSLVDNDQNNHHEIFVYINEDALVISQTCGKHLQHCVYETGLGLNNLYEVLSRESNIEIELVKKILNTNVIFKNQTNFEIINGCDLKMFQLIEANLANFKSIIDDFVKSIVKIIHDNIKYLQEHKHWNVEKVTYIPTSMITKSLINLTQIHNKSNIVVYKNNTLDEYLDYSNQLYIAINYILNVYNEQEHEIFNMQAKSTKMKKELNDH